MPENRISYSWLDIEEACDWIIEQTKKHNIRVDSVYGVPRGGLIPATIISHRLQVPLHLTLKGVPTTEYVLVVDDICDTGRTLQEFVNIHNNYLNLTIATVTMQSDARYMPRFSSTVENGAWVEFPWETAESSKIDNTPIT